MTKFDNYENALQYLEVFEDGSVFRKERTWVTGIGGIRYHPRQRAKTYITRKGYLRTKVWIEGRQLHLYIHRLIATAFLPKPEGWTEDWDVNHINGNKQNNDVSNLEWVTHSENIRHADRTGLRNLQKSVQMLNKKTGEVLITFCSVSEAERQMGVNKGNISACCLGREHYKSAGGYVWRFAS